MNGKQQVDPTFEALLDYLKRTRGFDFTGYKRNTLFRRVEKRLHDLKIKSFTDYLDYLEVHPEEFPVLFDVMLINVTSFFRDPSAWDYLAEQVIPKLLETRGDDAPIRAWSAACASGEEVFTLAILLAESLGWDAFKERVKIYATDVDEDALAQARASSYTAKDLKPVPEDLRDKYFEQAGERYVFSPDLRNSLIFGRHDLVEDAPISRLDLLACRNALMYFNAETQSRILAKFHFALNDDGYLFLGKAEMLLTQANLFVPTNMKARLFVKVPRRGLRDRIALAAQAGSQEAADQSIEGYQRLREAAFETGLMPTLIIDSDGVMIDANDRARGMFRLTARDEGLPLQDLELSYRPSELRSHIDQAYRERRPVVINDVEWVRGQDILHLEIHIAPLFENNGSRQGAVISFRDVSGFHQLSSEFQRQKEELESAYEELQSSNEELETTNEELQSTVEELETTNEELQASNEELETLNEEMQSTNEELQSMNDELQVRTSQLGDANEFLNSILASVRMGVAVIDEHGAIKVWNSTAEEMWGIRADEVQGRSFETLDIGLPVGDVGRMIDANLRGDGDAEPKTFEALNRRGRALRCRVTATALGRDGSRRGAVLMMEAEEL